MALEIATRRAREGESASEARALIEGDDGREAWVVIGSMGNHCDALPAPQRPSSPAAGSVGCSEERAKAEAVSGRVQRLVLLLFGTFRLRLSFYARFIDFR